MKKFLIIKIGAIGDVIMALPMIQAIRSEYGRDARITWIVGNGAKCILEQFNVDEIIVVDEKKLLGGTLLEKVSALFCLWKKLFLRKFDYIAIGYYNWKYRLISVVVQSPEVHRLECTAGRLLPIPCRHFTDEYIRLINRTDNSDMRNYQSVVLEINEDAKQRFAYLKAKVNKAVIALAPGGAKNILSDDAQRRWPIEKYVELAEILVADGYSVVITGAASDCWVEKYFSKLSIENYIGKTSLLELAALYSGVDLVVTHDSGPMHIAGLVKANLIALFGPTNPYEKIPKHDNVEFIWQGRKYPCCPCYDGRSYAMCNDNLCLKSITSTVVLERVKRLLAERGGHTIENSTYK
jgi:heptosyltransferase II